MDKVWYRNFIFHKFEFIYYRFLKFFLKYKNPTDTFLRWYTGFSSKASNLYFDNKFYFNTHTDIGKQLFFNGKFEDQELGLILSYIKEDSTVLDIGANHGYHTIHFASKAKNGKVYAFEPSRKTFLSMLDNTRNYKNIFPFNIGIGQENTILTFYEASDDAYSSFKDTKRKSIQNKVPVLCTKLDDFILHSDLFDKIDFVKIDVEGFEQQVLEGMKGTILKYKPIIFCEIVEGENSNPNPSQTFDFIKSMGYGACIFEKGQMVKREKYVATEQNYLFLPS